MAETLIDLYDNMDWYERQVWRAYEAVRSGTYMLSHLWWLTADVREGIL